MDHAQGRAFHHHLARAIMHLNYLVGLLPFFEPSIQFDDGPTNPPLHGESHSHRGLHTFVPLPTNTNPPSLASHGGLPTRLITNPELHLRPITSYSSHRSHSVPSYPSNHPPHPCSMSGPPNLPIHSDSVMDPHPEPRPLSDIPKTPSRPTIPVPVRSKQRSRTAQPKRNPRPRILQPLLHRTLTDLRIHISTLGNDDSDDSDSGDSYRLAGIQSDKAMIASRPWQIFGKASAEPPSMAKAPPVAVTSTVTLTPKPHETIFFSSGAADVA